MTVHLYPLPPLLLTTGKVSAIMQRNSGSNIAADSSLPTDIKEAKKLLRARSRTGLMALSPSMKQEFSRQTARNISGWEIFRRARYIAGFAADPNEPDLRDIFDRRFIFPRWNGNSYEMAHPDWDAPEPWSKGRFGLAEPTGSICSASDSPDVLWLVPGVVFSSDGGRIGRGGGFYDRLLARARGVFCGVFFDCQLTEAVPVEPHDCILHFLASESSIRPTAAGDQFFNGRIR